MLAISNSEPIITNFNAIIRPKLENLLAEEIFNGFNGVDSLHQIEAFH